jgi:hypothetical protein
MYEYRYVAVDNDQVRQRFLFKIGRKTHPPIAKKSRFFTFYMHMLQLVLASF